MEVKILKESIMKLLTSEHISNYKISKETGIAQTTLSDYATGKSKIGNMKLDHALKLNEFYNKNKELVEMLELTDYQMELSRPYALWTLHDRWYCVSEVVINKNTYEDGTIRYVVETTDYREIATLNGGYMTALNKLETYYDDNATHDYEEVARFDTFDEAMAFVDKEYPAIDIEAELDKYFEDEEDEQ